MTPASPSRALLLALLWPVLLAGCARPPQGGGGIVSTNPCADAMLVEMVPATRIAAVSHYSQTPGASSMPLALARRFRATAGTAEEVIALRPDLVVASSFTAPATRDAWARAGLKTLYLGIPASIAASTAQVRELAGAVDARPAGERIVQGIDQALRRTRPRDARRPRALLYIAGDLANGGGTLLDELMTHVGLTNAAAGYGLAFTGRLPAETLVAHPPELVIAPDTDRLARLRERLLPKTRAAGIDPALLYCGGPAIPPALDRLAAIRRNVP
ncbi:ABC transporter substrate-binding protein [Sphingomonas abaci]|uniref:Iron complex transport system substrate-binding protein n=1 Tax=Sphingomonas abaci TaxID=237611 RepID=A0A7W7EX31_9SPHN|nr:iron complex transport system substrate-binding protein [Sphingomonas abaci]